MMKFVPAVAHHFCLNFSGTFSQPLTNQKLARAVLYCDWKPMVHKFVAFSQGWHESGCKFCQTFSISAFIGLIYQRYLYEIYKWYQTRRGPPLSPLHESASFCPAQICFVGLMVIPTRLRLSQLGLSGISTRWRILLNPNVWTPFSCP